MTTPSRWRRILDSLAHSLSNKFESVELIAERDGGVWLCRCLCLQYIELTTDQLMYTKSCGTCKFNPKTGRVGGRWVRKNGHTKHPLFRLWLGIRVRTNPRFSHKYPEYSGRGIRLCKRWQNFANFVDDMGPRPSSDYSVDRIDTNGDYSPDNCRWATRKEQARNTRNNRMITAFGETKCLAQWAEDRNIPYGILRQRLHHLTPEEALNKPYRSNKRGLK